MHLFRGLRMSDSRRAAWRAAWLCGVLVAASIDAPMAARQASAAQKTSRADRGLIDKYCVTCHNQRLKTAGLALDPPELDDIAAHADVWEKVIRKLRTGAMPPAGSPRPDHAAATALVSSLETTIDRASTGAPNPGNVPVHRLNRIEYANAIRDLLGLAIDPRAFLPPDDADAHGFDNNAGVLSVSPALLERYVAASRKISRLAIGDTAIVPGFETYRVDRMLVQDERMSDELPFGSRGGVAVRHHFPVDGTYVVKLRLQRNLYDYIRGLTEPHELDVRIDGERVVRFRTGGVNVGKPAPATYAGNIPGDRAWEDYMHDGDAALEVRTVVKAGPRVVGVSFVKRHAEPEGILQPRVSGFTTTVDELVDGGPGIESVSIGGPYDATAPSGTIAHQRIFLCRPPSGAGAGVEEACAARILETLARRAYRRATTSADSDTLLKFYRAGRPRGGFEAGIQRGLERMLADPEFLFRIERSPGAAPGSVVRVSDVDLASRLSFFLWSSIPDDELLDVGIRGELRRPGVLQAQVRRMLADERAFALVENFASQWLTVRGLRGATPDPDLFPDFDENLRDAFRKETELFLDSQIRSDRSIVDLLTADYTFVNERLARHYGIPNVYGERFRRVAVTRPERMGLLGHGSVLTVTSYANRTSPVLRGKWILDNLLGAPPPPPPADVPGLVDNAEDGRPLSMRERMERHRKNPACATCHKRMDPIGFALENFDAIGAWRMRNESGAPVDATDTMPDGTTLQGVAGLRALLLARKDEVVVTAAEKLLMYALGRGLETYDQPAVRAMVREAAAADFRWSAVVAALVNSTPFQMRRTDP